MEIPEVTRTLVTERATQLLAYCRARRWAGHDPYDALNSPLVRSLRLLDTKWPRLVFTQALKRSPVDVRWLALVPATLNPKALALFLTSLLALRRCGALTDARPIWDLLELLRTSRSPDTSYWCWGYSFPWQTRTMLVPRSAPNLVCTAFVANALLDAYEELGDDSLLGIAENATDYILKRLYWHDGDQAGFSYPVAGHRTRIHNANLIGAALLCRVAALTGRADMVEPALRVARHSARRQRPDGSWPYGELPTQAWIDNFHTGYNLSALRALSRYTNEHEFEFRAREGFAFYLTHFFRDDGAPRYFHDATYPIDVHCVAQSLLTLVEFQDVHDRLADLVLAVFGWADQHLWDSRGYFYYRVLPWCTIRTPYMRWSQAWMLRALSAVLDKPPVQCKDAPAAAASPIQVS